MTDTWIVSKLSACKSSCDSISKSSPLKHRSSHLGLSIDLQTGSAGIEGRHLGDVVVLPLALLFLELEGDSADGTFLDALHEVGGEAGDFVAEAFGGDDGLGRVRKKWERVGGEDVRLHRLSSCWCGSQG